MARPIVPFEKHGKSRSKVYRTWQRMKDRCSNPNFAAYHRYGGRGISVAPEWVDDFPAFYAHVGDPPSAKHTLERIENDKGYEPGNVRWATRAEQARNRCDTVLLTYAGRTMVLGDWAKEVGISWDNLNNRLQRGWSLEKALTTPRKPLNKTKTLTHNGRTMTVPQWAKELGISCHAIHKRLRRGRSVAETLSLPSGQKYNCVRS